MITFSRNLNHHCKSRGQKKSLDNRGHNGFALYNILVQVWFTTSKTKLDMKYSKLGIKVASRVAKRLKI